MGHIKTVTESSTTDEDRWDESAAHLETQVALYKDAQYKDDEPMIKSAAERVTDALEDLARLAPDKKSKKLYKERAKELRKGNGLAKKPNALKEIGNGCLLIVTAPMLVVGAGFAATGAILTGTGSIMKGLGTATKKCFWGKF